MKKFIREGDKIGRFLILKPAGRAGDTFDNAPKWLIKCECGQEKVMVNKQIKTQKSCSRGCAFRRLRRDNYGRFM